MSSAMVPTVSWNWLCGSVSGSSGRTSSMFAAGMYEMALSFAASGCSEIHFCHISVDFWVVGFSGCRCAYFARLSAPCPAKRMWCVFSMT